MIIVFLFLVVGSCLSGDDSYGANEKPFDLVSSHYPGRSAAADHHQSSAAPYMRASENVHQQNVFVEEIHEKTVEHVSETHQTDAHTTNQTTDQSSTSNAFTTEIFNIEIDKLSLANRNLSDQLQSVRNQMGDNLNRVRDFEERVKLIPKLQLELSVEKAENRDLHLKLKALENALAKKEQHEQRRASEIVQSKMDSSTCTETFTSVLKENIAPKPFNAQRVCATSLESLNIRFPNSASPIESQQLHSINVSAAIKVPPCTHNVGCMTTKVVSRDVGVVTIPVQVPTRTMAINTDLTAQNMFDDAQKKPIMKNVSVQSDQDAKVRHRSIATITDREPPPPPPPKPVDKYSIGVMATPNVQSSSCMARPEVRSIGIENIYQPPRTRSFGTDPIKHLAETRPVAQTDAETRPTTLTDSPISLKLLDAPVKTAAAQSSIAHVPPPPPSSQPEPSAKSIEKPKEFRSMGVQYSPSVCSKFSQCNVEPPAPPPPPEIRKQNESTDTIDLTLHIHRGVNTDACAPKKDRPTNTDRIITEEKSTNTLIEKKTTSNSATNTDSQQELSKIEIDENASESIHFDEHKCHNCLTKIEIKQRTIIKNPNKIQDVVEAQNEEMLNSMQQMDLQSRIPRPTALISPRSDRKFTRQNTYTIPSSSLPSPLLTAHMDETAASHCPAEAYLS